MSETALQRPTKTSAYLVLFQWGDPDAPTELRVTDWTSTVTVAGERFASIPELEPTIPANTAGLREDPFELRLPLLPFTDRLTNGEPHSPVTVEVAEYVIGPRDSLKPTIFRGAVDGATRNPEGASGTVLLECVNVKNRLDVPLGIQANGQCSWIFGRSPCPVVVSAIEETRSVVTFVSALVTLDGLSAGKRWRKGYLEREGLRIGIRDFGSDQVALTEQPPRDWLGKEVRCVPGCDKTVETCRAYGAEGRFGGFGYAMPDRHPIIESRS